MRKVYRPFSPNLHHLLFNPDEQLPGGRLAGRLPPLLLLPLRHRRPLPHLPSTLTLAHRHPSLAHDAGVPGDVFFLRLGFAGSDHFARIVLLVAKALSILNYLEGHFAQYL